MFSTMLNLGNLIRGEAAERQWGGWPYKDQTCEEERGVEWRFEEPLILTDASAQ